MNKLLVPGIAVAMTLMCSINAFAMEVPTNTVVQNLNGSQQVIKTYTISPGTDPQTLIEEPFVLEGFQYTFADIVKEENYVQDTQHHTKTVTVETADNDLGVILEQLAPTVEYDDGQYSGTLFLDHTSIHTEASGYTTKYGSTTATKVISGLDRNDMSYVPATTVKGSRTLKLSNVDWQVTGTDLVGEVLMPSQYQAVATYSASTSWQAATGYVTTAEYVGEISRNDVDSITYTLTYHGDTAKKGLAGIAEPALDTMPYVIGGVGLVAAAVLGTLLLRSRRQVRDLQADEDDLEENEEQEVSVT